MTYTASQVLAAIKPYLIDANKVSVTNGGYQTSQSGSPFNGPYNVYLYKLPTNPPVFVFTSSGAIDCDGSTNPICTADVQGQSDTSFHLPNGQPIDQYTIPGFVLPESPAQPGMWDFAKNNIQGWQAGTIIYNNAIIGAAFTDERGTHFDPGDDGNGQDIGEFTYGACRLLGSSTSTCNPNTGGIDNGVTYIVYTTPANIVSPSNTNSVTLANIQSTSNNALNVMMSQLGSVPNPPNPQAEALRQVQSLLQQVQAEVVHLRGAKQVQVQLRQAQAIISQALV